MNIPTRIASRFSTGINACQYRIGATILLSGPFRPVRQAPRHTPAPSVSRHPTPSPIPLAASKAPRKKNKMGVVAKASASAGAAGRGVKIPGNTVLMLFRNDYAVSMLAASVPAGIEAPIRVYVTEDHDGKATVTYRTPTSVFAHYGSAELDAMARELDPVFDRIVRDAVEK